MNGAHGESHRSGTLFCPGASAALSGLHGPRVAVSANKTACAAERLRLAAQLFATSNSPPDLAHARLLVDSVQNGTEVTHDAALAGLADLLDRALADRRRADERIDKLIQQTHDQQLRIDDLNARLSALTDVERKMAQRASLQKVLP